MEKQLEREVRFLKRYAVIVTMFFVIFILSAFALRSDSSAVEEITATRINMVDSDGKVRVILAGEFPKSRADMAGLIFNNPDGSEAGGLGYRGKRDKDGRVEAGSILTFDQYGSDQVVSLGDSQTGDQKVLGLTVNDRPDTMSELVKEAYRAIEGAKTPGEADSLRRSYMSRIPARDIVARRFFAGRSADGSSLITLSDPDGKPRLRFQVDKSGKASIQFLDEKERVVRTIKPD